jgi:hypothetical protein
MPEAERRFTDTSGVIWRARERQTSGRGSALYFENDVAFRRVADYPDDWRDLPTDPLSIAFTRNIVRETAAGHRAAQAGDRGMKAKEPAIVRNSPVSSLERR